MHIREKMPTFNVAKLKILITFSQVKYVNRCRSFKGEENTVIIIIIVIITRLHGTIGNNNNNNSNNNKITRYNWQNNKILMTFMVTGWLLN